MKTNSRFWFALSVKLINNNIYLFDLSVKEINIIYIYTQICPPFSSKSNGCIAFHIGKANGYKNKKSHHQKTNLLKIKSNW